MATDGSHLFILDGNKIHKVSFVNRTDGGFKLGSVHSCRWFQRFTGWYGQCYKIQQSNGYHLCRSDLFIADQDSHKIRKLVIATGEVTTLAGNGAAGSTDGPGAQAMFNKPSGMTTDGVHLYVADQTITKSGRLIL